MSCQQCVEVNTKDVDRKYKAMIRANAVFAESAVIGEGLNSSQSKGTLCVCKLLSRVYLPLLIRFTEGLLHITQISFKARMRDVVCFEDGREVILLGLDNHDK